MYILLEPGRLNTMSEHSRARADNEIVHGRALAVSDTEFIWGWGTPAGRLRATRRADLIAKGAGLRPGAVALEIGCGTGMFTQIFARSGARILAVDISPDLLQKARARDLSSSDVTFLEKRFEDCDSLGPFDAIIGSSILHHLEVREALSKIYNLLKPGGVISFAEPNMMNPQIFLERKFRKFFPHISPDETAFIRWELRKTLIGAGFSSIDVRPFDFLHPAIPPPFIGIATAIGRVIERTAALKEFAGSLYIYGKKPERTGVTQG
ncbi:MAG: methyltransferase [Candidatus Omnitrophica bacterium]|nr:methyltransferase [Candidatus Omnitrophota bacterium]